MTDTAQAVINSTALKCAYSALKFIHQKTADKKIENLMFDLINYANNCNMDECINAIENEFNKQGESDNMQTAKEKKKTFTDRENAIEFNSSYYELALTEFGKEVLTAEQAFFGSVTNLDGLDLFQTAYLKILELIENGMIVDFDSLLNCRRLINNAVHKAIDSERKPKIAYDSKVNAYLTKTSRNGKTVYLNLNKKSFDKEKENIEIAREIILKHLDSRVNIDNVSAYFKLHYLDRLTQGEIAIRLNISDRTCRKYQAYIKDVCSKVEVYNLLHEILENW